MSTSRARTYVPSTGSRRKCGRARLSSCCRRWPVASKTSVQQLYGELWADENPLDVELQESLEPRGTEWLFAAFAELGPQPGQLVADGVADWIWCRDVLVHVELERGFAECARILRPGGQMLAYVTCATDLLEPREAATLFDALAIVPESTDPDALDRHAAAAGLTLVSSTPLDGEWRERMIEDASWDPGEDLLRLSRLHRREEELVERHGAARVAAYAAARAWGVYQLLGKLRPTIYLWQRDA